MEENQLVGSVSIDQIEVWKRTHGEVYEIEVGGSVCYLKKPDRSAVSYMANIGQSNPIKANEFLLKHCWLGGDEAIQSDDELFFGAAGVLGDLVKAKTAQLKKL